jgi:two-component system, LytTR family, response regulator
VSPPAHRAVEDVTSDRGTVRNVSPESVARAENGASRTRQSLRVVVVDDEPLSRERVSALVQGTDGLELVGQARNGIEALDVIDRTSPDLVFIDVEMPELSGFGVIAALDRDRVPGVVFVTAFERYALDAFDVGAIDYLHKPVTEARFAAAAARARERLTGSASEHRRRVAESAERQQKTEGVLTRFVAKVGDAHHLVPVDEVDWIDVADNYLQLHVGERTHLVRGTMKDAVERLDPKRFVRIHRSTMVAVNRIATVKPHPSGGFVVRLRNGAKLKSSRGYGEALRDLLR